MRRIPRVRIELGRARLAAAEVSKLKVGSIVELAEGAYDDVDVAADGCLVARGEAASNDGEFCVRLRHVAESTLRERRS